MPTTKEFTVHLEDKPGILGKFCRTLAEKGVNIVAFQATPGEKKSLVRFVVDNPTATRTVLDSERQAYTETDVARVKLQNRPGELGRAAVRLGDANINISYAYSGADPATNAPILIFGVSEAGKAATILDQASAAASTS
jgi:hypothetical protein